jgi:hypothetical protein
VAAEALLERPPASSPQVSKPPKPLISILERILLEQDLEGLGITQVVTTEISIILWLMMEVGNAWTAMALNLLSTDKEACRLVQEELDVLEREHGHTALFSPAVLGRMRYLDALLYEAIRLTPANLGGMKMTTQTVEFADLGVQIPKNSHILFCQASNMKFDIEKALGHKPELLGSRYPCVELYVTAFVGKVCKSLVVTFSQSVFSLRQTRLFAFARFGGPVDGSAEQSLFNLRVAKIFTIPL